MNSNPNEILRNVACDVFEQLAFMFGELIDLDEAESDSDNFLKASMTFKGEKNGHLEIIVPEELAKSLANNILGLEEAEDLEAGSSEDALKELLNTICGQYLPKLFGDEEIFNLSPPDIASISFDDWEPLLANDDYQAIEIENKSVLLYQLFKEDYADQSIDC